MLITWWSIMTYKCQRMFCIWHQKMGRLNWNGNRQPKYWTKNNRLYGVKLKLSYKSEGLERLLFLQLIKEKWTNLDKFPPLNYHKILSPLLLLSPLLEFQKKFPPINMSPWNLGPTPTPHPPSPHLCRGKKLWINSNSTLFNTTKFY